MIPGSTITINGVWSVTYDPHESRTQPWKVEHEDDGGPRIRRETLELACDWILDMEAAWSEIDA